MMKLGICKPTLAGEKRVALTPDALPLLAKAGVDVWIEKGAGELTGFQDEEYTFHENCQEAEANEIRANVDILAGYRLFEEPVADANKSVLIGMANLPQLETTIQQLAKSCKAAFALDLMPRITRAQSMDVLSSMATVAGYKAVLMAADRLPRFFPMMMTAAGTVQPARVLVIGAGVAGLQAIATARRLGAIVHAWDVRPAVKEQCESLGAHFLELSIDSSQAEDSGGYAKEQSEEFLKRQREMMARAVAENQVIITTAAIPGKPSPLLVTGEMVEAMSPGSVIVDLAAERGGNCEWTEAGKVVERNGVTIFGPLNLAGELPYHASRMYARNLVNFLSHIVVDDAIDFDSADEILSGTLVAKNGEIVHPFVGDLLKPAPQADTDSNETRRDS